MTAYLAYNGGVNRAQRASPRMRVRYFDEQRLVNYAPLDKANDDTREQLTEAEWSKVQRFVLSGVNANTKRMYRAHWADFAYFCQINRLRSLPARPESIALYLATLAEGELKRSTLQARLAAIVKVHDWRFAGTADYTNPGRDPLVKLALGAAIRQRVLEREAVRQVDALSPDDIATLLDQLDEVYPGDANALKVACYRALLLIGFAGGFRRSELVAVRLRDVRRTTHGLRIVLPYSKTDQIGSGMDKFINKSTKVTALCPVRALDGWLAQSNIRSKGPDSWVFPSFGSRGQMRTTHLSDKMVALLVQKLARRSGFPNWRELGGHSLRAGFITSALRQGNAEWKVRRQTGHRSSQAFRRYIRGQQDGGDAATVL